MSELYCLEIGCGQILTTKEGENILHTDKFPAKKEIQKLDVEKAFPFANNTFDKVYAYNIIEHVNDFYFTVNEIHRVLKPKGILYCCMPHVYSYMGWRTQDHHLCNSELFQAYEKHQSDMDRGMEELAQKRIFKRLKFDYCITLGTIFKPLINHTIGFKNYEQWIGRTMPLNIDMMFFELQKE